MKYLAIILMTCLLGQSTGSSQNGIVALTHVTVIDVSGAPAKPDMTVVLTKDRITAVGKTGAVRLPRGVRVIDARGKFLIPGLWDMHVHLSFAGETALAALIVNGVTGARDLGGDLNRIDSWRREIESGDRIGPRIFRAGPFVDGPKKMAPDREACTLILTNADEARKTVISLKQQGVDLIKIHNALPREAFFALLQEAKRQNLPVAVHLPRTGIRSEEAAAAGVESLEHTENLLESVVFGTPGQRKGPKFIVV
jgi:imidazolonepropionase-like amidohydrolase